MKTLLLLLHLAISIHCHRLTAKENAKLQETCGRPFSRASRLSEFPLAASVNISEVLKASVISSRHLLLFNVVEKKDNGKLSLFGETPFKRVCDGDHLVLPNELNDVFTIQISKKSKQPANIKRIMVLQGCSHFNNYLPTVVELKEDVPFDKDHQPICISKSSNIWPQTKTISVSGLGPGGKSVTTAKLTPKKCTRPHLPATVVCAKPVDESLRLCASEFGGGAVAEIGGRSTLLGIIAESNEKCEKKPKKQQELELIDVSYYTGLICEATGVCVHVKEAPVDSSESSEDVSEGDYSDDSDDDDSEDDYSDDSEDDDSDDSDDDYSEDDSSDDSDDDDYDDGEEATAKNIGSGEKDEYFVFNDKFSDDDYSDEEDYDDDYSDGSDSEESEDSTVMVEVQSADGYERMKIDESSEEDSKNYSFNMKNARVRLELGKKDKVVFSKH